MSMDLSDYHNLTLSKMTFSGIRNILNLTKWYFSGIRNRNELVKNGFFRDNKEIAKIPYVSMDFGIYQIFTMSKIAFSGTRNIFNRDKNGIFRDILILNNITSLKYIKI